MEQMNSDWFNDWRSDCPKIQDGNGHLLATGIYSDVTFIIEEDDGHPSPIISRIKAHQFILKTRSPVFDTMFNEIWTQEPKAHNNNGINVNRIGQIGDKTNKSTNGLEIKIVDTTREYFEAFLKFLYSDYFMESQSKESVVGLLYLAHKYIVAPLAAKCSGYLEKTITLKNVIEIYQMSEMFQQYNLRDAAFEFMLRYARALAVEPHFIHIEESLLKKLIESDYMQIEEMNLFRAVLKWATNKKQREVQNSDPGKTYEDILKDIIPLMRFTQMDPQEFTTALELIPDGLLDDEEIISIYKYLTTKGIKLTPTKLRFETRKRHLKFNGENYPQKYTVGLYLYDETCDRNRLHYIYGPRGRIHDESLQFTTNRDVFINGIGLYGPALSVARTNGEYSLFNHQVDVAIYSIEVGNDHARPIIARFRKNQLVQSDYEIPFDPPVRVRKDRVYHVQLAFQGEETKHGVSRLSTVKAKCGGQLVIFNLVSPQLAEGLHSPPQGRIRSISFHLPE